MKIVAAELKRPKTNLVTNPEYHLNREEMKTGFMGVFNWAYSGDSRKTLFKLAFAPLVSAVPIPMGKRPAPKNAEQRKARKNENTLFRNWEADRKKLHLGQYTKLRKVASADDPHFLLSVPVMVSFDATGFASTFSMFSGVPLDDNALESVSELFDARSDKTYSADLAMKRSGLPGSTLDIFRTTLTGVVYEFGTHGMMTFLNFKIKKPEAQALVSADWMEIRPVDLYPLFSMWVEAEFISKYHSKTVTSLSRIAATLPKHDPADERTDEFGIGVTLDGDPIWLPKECNNTQKYESMFASASAHPGDTFALRTASDPADPVLPANIPILVDWVNNKFTYSNSAGKPVIMALEHVRKCTASMAMNILRRPVADKYFERLKHFAQVAGVSDSPARYGLDTNASSVADYVNELVAKREGYVLRYIDLTTDQHDAEMEGVKAFVRAVYEGIKNHLDAFYAQYAVSTTMEHLGVLGLIVHYGTDMAKTRVAANTQNQKALNQGLTPDWNPPDMPLVTSKFGTPEGGMLPHQAKIRNLLKDSPDYAVLSVDAGGGKSMLSITDILYEIKASRSQPYLIMCPSHLVANYVAELVEFTDGLVNVIPVTSFNIRTTGFARYEEILKTSPINTVLVVDYDALKFRAKAMGYGTAAVAVYPVIEMIRQFKPGYAMLDESHFLRNMKSARTRSVLSLVADIPKKRIASGTLNPDSPSDLAGQLAILDPSIFGSRDNFNQTYGEDVRGNRVMRWRTKGPNSINEVMPKLKETVVWAQAKRKEWACALPPREDKFVGVDLTPAQRQMYNAIFDDMIQQIRKDAEKNKSAKKLLDKLTGNKASKTDEDDFGDLGDETEGEEDEDNILDDVEDVGPALQPYLADIERFVTDPSSHAYSKNGIVMANGERVPPLSGDDLMPPKAVALKGLLEQHLKESKSKVIVFVNYNQSAESMFNAMPEELRAQGMLYTASQKTELVNKFKTDDSVRWMIGIRRSLEVGLNLQVAGCLIRLEGVWNPGEQEQGDSRIARPYFGPGGDQREVLKFFTVVADKTIDITKAARLRAKMVAVAKFENTGNPNYEAIEDIPIIPMNLETITTQNDFRTDLAQYQTSMAMLNQVIHEENEEYKQKILAEGGFKFTQVKRSSNPSGAALLARVPYAQGTELYKASELGMIRVDNYLGMELADEEDDDEGPEEENEVENDVVKQQRAMLMGMRAHCEFGDGIIIGAASAGGQSYVSRLSLRLDDGTTVKRLRSTNVFVVTRTETNSVDMRNKLAQAAGLNITADITVPGAFVKQTKFTQKELREQERQRELERKKLLKKSEKVNKAISVSLELQVVNGYLRFGYTGSDSRVTKALESLGFRMDQPHYYARIRSYRHLLKQVGLWADSGFNTTNQVDNESLQLLTNELAKNGLQSHRHYTRLTNSGGFGNYLRTIWKPTVDKKLLNMFALVTDGGHADAAALRQAEKNGTEPNFAIAYLCLPAGAGHPGSKLAVSSKYRVPGVTWYMSEPSLSIFAGSLNGARTIFMRLKEAGISINNTDELNKIAQSVRKMAFKVDDHVDVKDEDIEEEEAPKRRGPKRRG